MSQRQDASDEGAIGNEIERIVCDFVCIATEHLSKTRTGHLLSTKMRFARGDDGHYRGTPKAVWTLHPMIFPDCLHALPNYERCNLCLRSDEVIGKHFDRLVGIKMAMIRLTVDQFLIWQIEAMLGENGVLAFSTDAFQSQWEDWMEFFKTDEICFTTIAPIPNLELETNPVVLSNEVALDRLTVEEVETCYELGVMRSNVVGFTVIMASAAVGVRRTHYVPKLIEEPGYGSSQPDASDDGRFGTRPFARGDLVVDDVLCTLRLIKGTQARATGLATWSRSPFVRMMNTDRTSNIFWYNSQLRLCDAEIEKVLKLWNDLSRASDHIHFCIHRFNLAFERKIISDRIVDLVIAAEGLFLSDTDDNYRGELRFRLALRAAKFIEKSGYSEKRIFDLMRQAYDARSAIVHGSLTPKRKALSDLQVGDIEDIMRLALRKAVDMKSDASRLRQSAYWNGLILSEIRAT